MKPSLIRRACAGGAAVAAIAYCGLSAAPAIAADASSTTLFATTITYEDGSTAQNAAVRISALPVGQSGDTIASTILGNGITDANGGYTAKIPASTDLTPFTRSDGSIDIEIDAGDGVNSISYDQIIAAPPQAVSGSAHAAAQRSTQKSFLTKPGAATRIALRLHGSKPSARTRALDVTPDTEGVSGHNCTSGYTAIWVKQSSSKRVSASVIKLMTKGNSSEKYDWSTKDDTELDASYEYTGTDGTVTANAGLQSIASGSAGTTFSAGNNKTQYGDLDMRYFKYEKECSGIYSFNQGVHDAKAWQWRPYDWSGGTSYETAPSPFSCNSSNATSISNDLWVARSVSNTISAALNIDGLDLSAKQTNTSDTKLTFNPDSGAKARLCGNNDVPTSANQVREY